MLRFKFVAVFFILAICILPQNISAAAFKKGVKLNTFFRVTSAAPVKFLERYGITLADLMATADLKNENNKEVLPLLNSIKPADFPYAFFYTNEFLFNRRFPGLFAIKVDNAAWITLIRAGAEKGAGEAGKIKNRFYKIPREDLVMEILPDGVLMVPADEAAEMPELKSLKELHDTITTGMGVQADETAFVEYNEQSGFGDINERLQMLFRSRWQQSGMGTKHMATVDAILKRMLRNPFLKAVLSTKQTSVRISLKDGFAISSEYTLGAPSHKDAFLKSLSAMQVLGSIGTTLGIAAWETQMGGAKPTHVNMRIGMDLFNKFAESFEKIRISERQDKIALSWQFVTGDDLVPAMQLAKNMIEQKKAEQRASERVETVRDEVCAALARKDKEKFKAKVAAYAEMLPVDEHKIWRVRQSCSDGSGVLLSALEFGGEDTFLKLVGRLKYHMGFAPMTNGQGKGFLHIAIERRYDKALKQILDDGIVANTADNAGKTPLIYAIESKNAATVKLLLDRGLTILGENDAAAVKKTQDAAAASGSEKIKELVEAALKRERALRKKHQTQS